LEPIQSINIAFHGGEFQEVIPRHGWSCDANVRTSTQYGFAVGWEGECVVYERIVRCPRDGDEGAGE
jgi:hypothetical protein